MLVFLSSCILQGISQLHLHWKVYWGRDMIIGLFLLLLRTLQILHQCLLLLNVWYKGPSSQRYGFSSSHVWMWELDYKESWAPKNWCFWTVVLERLLSIPWTARKSNQSILKEISPEYSLEGWCWSWNSNTLATWCEELTHWKRPWCWERLRGIHSFSFIPMSSGSDHVNYFEQWNVGRNDSG